MTSISTPSLRLSKPLAGVLFELARSAGDRPALFLPQEQSVAQKSWRQLADDVLRMTAYFDRWGVRPGDRIALWSDNRYEWIVIDLAIQSLQAIHVPLHGSLTAPSAAAQIAHAECKVVLAATGAMAAALRREPAATFLSSAAIEVLDGAGDLAPLVERLARFPVEAGAALYDERVARFDPESIATILYSSGTTGEPKGVALTHANLITNAYAVIEVLEESPSWRRLNFLPLSHIYARTCDLYAWLAGGSQLVLARNRETVCADCQLTQPTMINAVPFFYQRIAQRVAESERTHASLTIQGLLGGNLSICLCGGAPLPVDTFDFYHARGVMLLPGYGLTESSPVITVGTPWAFRRGAVGKAIPDIEVRIAEDGEILTRGPHVMKEYWKEPDLTRQAIRDGWLYTGDLGAIDADGYISVTGRKKELIALSTGKKAVPTHIEGLLLREPLIAQAMVVGNNQPCLAALIVPNHDLLRRWIDSAGLPAMADADATSHPRVLQLYGERIAGLLAPLPTYEQVKRFALLNQPFTIEAGHLTPKQSLRRDALARDFSAEIAGMYAGGGATVDYRRENPNKQVGDHPCESV